MQKTQFMIKSIFNKANNQNIIQKCFNTSNAQVVNTNERRTKNVINPFDHDDFFDLKRLVNLEQLFKARVHYGHHIGLRNPWMNDYIFGTRLGIDIINLEKTCKLMQDALNFAAHIAFRNGIIMMVTRDATHIPKVENLAKKCGEYAHCRNWTPGTFTDSTHVFKSVVRLPDLLIFFNTLDNFNEQHVAVMEAAKMLIPTIGVVDTNSDPNLISYPIPGNDDSEDAVHLYLSLFEKAIMAGKEKRKQLLQQNYEISYDT